MKRDVNLMEQLLPPSQDPPEHQKTAARALIHAVAKDEEEEKRFLAMLGLS